MFPQIDHPTKEIFRKDSNVDLRSFPYVITYRPANGNIWEITSWLREIVGVKSVNWTCVIFRIQLRGKTTFMWDWRFKTKEALVLFKLRWL